MIEGIELNRPWMVAVWPGMGKVAISAGYYLVAKLGTTAPPWLKAETPEDLRQQEVG